MELTLLVPPADAARLPRLPVLKQARTGRSRGQAVRIVWHDSLDRALATDGLALAEQRGTWRLERHMPAPTDPWPPATDHLLVEETTAPDGFSHALPEAMTPVAAFEGRRTVFPLTIDNATVSLTILDGVLRAVAAERPAARLILEGDDAAVRTLMRSLADAVSVSVPEHSLGTQAVHLADSTKPKPRRHGAPALPHDGLSVAAAFGHIIGHLTDVILHLAPLNADTGTGPEPVHQLRVAVRRARSTLSLFPRTPDSASVAEGLRQLGHMLGPARDWDVFMTETAPPVETVLPDQSGLPALLRAGTRRRRLAREALSAYLTSKEFRLLGLELSWLSAAEPPPSEIEPPGLNAFAASVLQTRWKKLVNAGKALDDLDNTELHGLRLKAKRLRYAAEFFAPLFAEKQASRFIRRLADLQEDLGVFNDTAAADALSRELSGKPGYAAGLVLGFTAARGAGIRPKITHSWARFRRREPFWV
jgi:CHAD domain-containing protein